MGYLPAGSTTRLVAPLNELSTRKRTYYSGPNPLPVLVPNLTFVGARVCLLFSYGPRNRQNLKLCLWISYAIVGKFSAFICIDRARLHHHHHHHILFTIKHVIQWIKTAFVFCVFSTRLHCSVYLQCATSLMSNWLCWQPAVSLLRIFRTFFMTINVTVSASSQPQRKTHRQI